MIINGVMYNDDMSEADIAKNEDLCNSVYNNVDTSKVWIKYDGTAININEMSTQHIINCLNMMERNGHTDNKYINIFLIELANRNVVIKQIKKTIVVYEMI